MKKIPIKDLIIPEVLRYKTCDGSHWSAIIRGTNFLLTNRKTGATHEDPVVRYVTWDGNCWEASLLTDNRFVQKSLANGSVKIDFILKYKSWDDIDWSLRVEGNGFHHFINYNWVNVYGNVMTNHLNRCSANFSTKHLHGSKMIWTFEIPGGTIRIMEQSKVDADSVIFDCISHGMVTKMVHKEKLYAAKANGFGQVTRVTVEGLD